MVRKAPPDIAWTPLGPEKIEHLIGLLNLLQHEADVLDRRTQASGKSSHDIRQKLDAIITPKIGADQSAPDPGRIVGRATIRR
jgi:hypothetical protein